MAGALVGGRPRELASRLWNGFFFSGFSGDGLALLRICFGVGLFFFHFTQFSYVFSVDPFGPRFRFLEPIWYFDLLGVERNAPLLSLAVFALLLLATLGMIVGWRTRLSIAVVMLCIVVLKGMRDSFTGDVHHRYLVPFHMLGLLLLSRCGDLRSLDARRRGTAAPVAEWEASWPIKTMQLYVVSFYFWAGVAKLRMSGWDWVAGGQRVRDLLISRSLLWGATETGEPAFNPLPYWVAQHETLCFLLALGSLVMELGFPLLLLLRSARARLLCLLGVTVFHVANTVLAYVGFALFPIVFLIFFDLEDVRLRLRAWRLRRARAPA